MGSKMQKRAGSLLIVWLLGSAGARLGCQSVARARDDFFAQAKLIMTKTEIEIYAHLADDQAREEFIRDFWEKRDPSPESAENEFREDFYKRIEFANRWFQERGPADSGWDSERGHILVILGFPDRRERMPMLDRPRAKAAEVWIYTAHALRLEFIDVEGLGRFRLDIWPLELLDAIEQVRELGAAAGRRNYFRFKVRCDRSGLRIEIPLKTVRVEERGGSIRAAFAVSVDVYCDFVKLDRLSLTREFIEGRAEFAARKSIVITVPYPFPKPGKYVLDVTVEERISGQRFRDVARFKRTRKG